MPCQYCQDVEDTKNNSDYLSLSFKMSAKRAKGTVTLFVFSAKTSVKRVIRVMLLTEQVNATSLAAP